MLYYRQEFIIFTMPALMSDIDSEKGRLRSGRFVFDPSSVGAGWPRRREKAVHPLSRPREPAAGAGRSAAAGTEIAEVFDMDDFRG